MAVNIFGVITNSMAIIVECAILISTFYTTFYAEKKFKGSTKLLSIAITEYILFFIFNVFALLNHIFHHELYQYTKNGALIFGIIVFYAFVVFRLHLTFKESAYAMTKISKYCQLIMLLMISIMLVLSIVFLILKVSIGIAVSTAFLIILFVFGLGRITYEFNSKLFNVILLQRQHDYEVSVSTTSDSLPPCAPPQSLTRSQLKLINAMAKQTLLSTFVFSCLLLICIFFVIMIPVSRIYDTNTISNFMVVATRLVGVISAILFTIITYVGFSVHSKIYNTMCKVCDGKLQSICALLAEKRIHKIMMSRKVKSKSNYSISQL